MIITIDGPAGSGKSTAARELAKRLGIAHLDTGATYRAVTLKALLENANMEDEAALAALARRADIRLIPNADGTQVFLDGCDVTRDIRASRVTENAFYIARSTPVRSVLVELQRKVGKQLGSFVTEGRDQGSVVFPDADFKFFLDASPEVRAQRRCEELTASGQEARYEDILAAIVQRDTRDRARATGPLVKPPDAIEIDTSGRTIEQTSSELLRHVGARR